MNAEVWLDRIIDWATSPWMSGGIIGALFKIALAALLVYLLGVGLLRLIDVVGKLRPHVETLLPRLSPTTRAFVRKRRYFCNVLVADLATIGKAENWNDGAFTDLEAAVEVEGYYRRTISDRLLRRRPAGLRRASSIFRALESSAERNLLVVGDPGSGKSVALRHLAAQIAARSAKSHSPNAQLPLYVNLKELQLAAGVVPTADMIRQFVIDNIRRGDADTADYVRSNWREFSESGYWFFLLDSFDEIPAVMHSPADSPVVRQYGEAIRQFLSGMSGCRGIVASREHKCPSAPWARIRLLPMSEAHQVRLVRNALLSHSHESIAINYAADSGSMMATNPMFLALVCRHVRDQGCAPIHDYSLLADHLRRLAHRDPEYVGSHYQTTPQELLEAARVLAAAIAFDMSLIPRVDAAVAALAKAGYDDKHALRILVGAHEKARFSDHPGQPPDFDLRACLVA